MNQLRMKSVNGRVRSNHECAIQRNRRGRDRAHDLLGRDFVVFIAGSKYCDLTLFAGYENMAVSEDR